MASSANKLDTGNEGIDSQLTISEQFLNLQWREILEWPEVKRYFTEKFHLNKKNNSNPLNFVADFKNLSFIESETKLEVYSKLDNLYELILIVSQAAIKRKRGRAFGLFADNESYELAASSLRQLALSVRQKIETYSELSPIAHQAYAVLMLEKSPEYFLAAEKNIFLRDEIKKLHKNQKNFHELIQLNANVDLTHSINSLAKKIKQNSQKRQRFHDKKLAIEQKHQQMGWLQKIWRFREYRREQREYSTYVKHIEALTVINDGMQQLAQFAEIYDAKNILQRFHEIINKKERHLDTNDLNFIKQAAKFYESQEQQDEYIALVQLLDAQITIDLETIKSSNAKLDDEFFLYLNDKLNIIAEIEPGLAETVKYKVIALLNDDAPKQQNILNKAKNYINLKRNQDNIQDENKHAFLIKCPDALIKIRYDEVELNKLKAEYYAYLAIGEIAHEDLVQANYEKLSAYYRLASNASIVKFNQQAATLLEMVLAKIKSDIKAYLKSSSEKTFASIKNQLQFFSELEMVEESEEVLAIAEEEIRSCKSNQFASVISLIDALKNLNKGTNALFMYKEEIKAFFNIEQCEGKKFNEELLNQNSLIQNSIFTAHCSSLKEIKTKAETFLQTQKAELSNEINVYLSSSNFNASSWTSIRNKLDFFSGMYQDADAENFNNDFLLALRKKIQKCPHLDAKLSLMEKMHNYIYSYESKNNTSAHDLTKSDEFRQFINVTKDSLTAEKFLQENSPASFQDLVANRDLSVNLKTQIMQKINQFKTINSDINKRYAKLLLESVVADLQRIAENPSINSPAFWQALALKFDFLNQKEIVRKDMSQEIKDLLIIKLEACLAKTRNNHVYDEMLFSLKESAKDNVWAHNIIVYVESIHEAKSQLAQLEKDFTAITTSNCTDIREKIKKLNSTPIETCNKFSMAFNAKLTKNIVSDIDRLGHSTKTFTNVEKNSLKAKLHLVDNDTFSDNDRAVIRNTILTFVDKHAQTKIGNELLFGLFKDEILYTADASLKEKLEGYKEVASKLALLNQIAEIKTSNQANEVVNILKDCLNSDHLLIKDEAKRAAIRIRKNISSVIYDGLKQKTDVNDIKFALGVLRAICSHDALDELFKELTSQVRSSFAQINDIDQALSYLDLLEDLRKEPGFAEVSFEKFLVARRQEFTSYRSLVESQNSHDSLTIDAVNVGINKLKKMLHEINFKSVNTETCAQILKYSRFLADGFVDHAALLQKAREEVVDIIKQKIHFDALTPTDLNGLLIDFGLMLPADLLTDGTYANLHAEIFYTKRRFIENEFKKEIDDLNNQFASQFDFLRNGTLAAWQSISGKQQLPLSDENIVKWSQTFIDEYISAITKKIDIINASKLTQRERILFEEYFKDLVANQFYQIAQPVINQLMSLSSTDQQSSDGINIQLFSAIYLAVINFYQTKSIQQDLTLSSAGKMFVHALHAAVQKKGGFTREIIAKLPLAALKAMYATWNKSQPLLDESGTLIKFLDDQDIFELNKTNIIRLPQYVLLAIVMELAVADFNAYMRNESEMQDKDQQKKLLEHIAFILEHILQEDELKRSVSMTTACHSIRNTLAKVLSTYDEDTLKKEYISLFSSCESNASSLNFIQDQYEIDQNELALLAQLEKVKVNAFNSVAADEDLTNEMNEYKKKIYIIKISDLEICHANMQLSVLDTDSEEASDLKKLINILNRNRLEALDAISMLSIANPEFTLPTNLLSAEVNFLKKIINHEAEISATEQYLNNYMKNVESQPQVMIDKVAEYQLKVNLANNQSAYLSRLLLAMPKPLLNIVDITHIDRLMKLSFNRKKASLLLNEQFALAIDQLKNDLDANKDIVDIIREVPAEIVDELPLNERSLVKDLQYRFADRFTRQMRKIMDPDSYQYEGDLKEEDPVKELSVAETIKNSIYHSRILSFFGTASSSTAANVDELKKDSSDRLGVLLKQLSKDFSKDVTGKFIHYLFKDGEKAKETLLSLSNISKPVPIETKKKKIAKHSSQSSYVNFYHSSVYMGFVPTQSNKMKRKPT